MGKIYRFGTFTLDADDQTLSSAQGSVHLPTKEFEILILLIENNGEVLGKEMMVNSVWRDTFVEEGNVAQYVSRLRKILNVDGQQFIKTFSKRGYKFSADISVSERGPVKHRHMRISVNGPERTGAAGTDDVAAMAVLPFRSLTPQADDDYLGIGITDALITRLTGARRPRYFVTSVQQRPHSRSEPNSRSMQCSREVCKRVEISFA